MKISFKKTEFSISELLYYIFFILMIGAKGMGLYDGQLIYKILLLISFLLVITKILIEDHSTIELVLYPILLTLLLYNYYLCRDKGLIVYFFMAFGLKKVKICNVYKIGAITLASTMTLNALIATCGLHMGPVILHNKLGGEIIRYSLGNSHPNITQLTYFILTCFVLLYLNERGERLVKANIITFIGSIIVFIYTVSYTSFLLSILLFCAVFYYSFSSKNISIIEAMMSYFIFISIVGISTCIPFFLSENNPLYSYIDTLLHYRLSHFKSYYKLFPISIFGQSLDLGPLKNSALDNSFISLLLRNGFVLFIIIIIANIFTINRLINKQQKLEILIFIILYLGGFCEAVLFNSSFRNIAFLWFGLCYFDMILSAPTNKLFLHHRLNSVSINHISIKLLQFNKQNFDKYRKAIIILCFSITLVSSAIFLYKLNHPKIYGIPNIMWNDEIEYSRMCTASEYYSSTLNREDIIIIGNYAENTPISFISTTRIHIIESIRCFIFVPSIVFSIFSLLLLLTISGSKCNKPPLQY